VTGEILVKKTAYIIAALFLAGVAHAGEKLSSDELTVFYSDKTLTGVHFKRGLSKTYYGVDGIVTSKSEDGTERVGKWWIDSDTNKRCIRWNHKNKDFCHYVERNNDGTYTLIHGKKGKKIVEIQSTQEGNHL
jgi:hypothetical protein